MVAELAQLLALAVGQNASDLHLSAGLPPMIRVDGDIQPITRPPLSDQDVHGMIETLMDDSQRQAYAQRFEMDFCFEAPGLGRFRVNAFRQNRGSAAVFRHIPGAIRTLEALHAPQIFSDLCGLRVGLVLVTGATGSGKSTTLAAMIDHCNTHRNEHILTIEDPIEFVHEPRRCLINQRELRRDTTDFSSALRSALREDPDIIMVGELRDLATIRLALTAAETGHLVFATLHTRSAAKTIDRIVDVFPGEEKTLVRAMLSESLSAVLSQSLLKQVGGGRIAAHEIMVATPAIRNLIREGKIAQMQSVIQTGSALGMQTLDQCLAAMQARGLITKEEAKCAASHQDVRTHSSPRTFVPCSK